MKLYQVPISLFACRCVLQVRAKGLDIDLVEPPGGAPSSDEYKAINPIGRVPALDVEGTVIPESQVICDFLEDRFPTPPCYPKDDLGRAKARLVARLVDVYVAPPLSILFGHYRPEDRDDQVVTANLEKLAEALDHVEHFLDDTGPFAAGAEMSVADFALFPVLFYVSRLLPTLGAEPPTGSRPKLASWWSAILEDDLVSQVNEEMQVALTEFLRRAS